VTLVEFLNSIPPGAWAVIGTIVGGVLLKVTEKWLGLHQQRIADDQNYRETINELRERLDKVEEEVTTWRTKYYAAQEEIASLRTSLIRAGITVPQTSVE